MKRIFCVGKEETLTIISVEKTPEENSAVLETVENGAMVISERDTPELWKQVVKLKKYSDAKIAADLLIPEKNAGL